MIKQFIKTIKEHGKSISDLQLSQLERYFELLVKTNEVMNLTAITERNEVYWKHFYDSMTPLFHFDLNDKNIADIGSGAGFPGIVIAIMSPTTTVTIVDSLNKRIEFLHTLIKELNLSNVKAFHGRAEEFATSEQHREQYDVVFARAVARLSILLELCAGFVKVGGKFIAMKATKSEIEVAESLNAQNKLAVQLKESITLSLPGGEHRTLLAFDKVATMSKEYPRQFGKIKNKPL